MFATLNVIENTYSSKIQDLFSYLRRNKVEVYYRKTAAIRIKCIDYQKFKRKIDWNRIDAEIGDKRCRILCGKNLSLPKELEYRRFDCHEYKQRLCKNTAIHILKESVRKLSVGIIDDEAMHTELPEYLTKYTDDIVVVTQRDDVYRQVADRLLEETGAPISVFRTTKSLHNCDLIISLSDIISSVGINKKSVILATKKVNNGVSCHVIHDYVVDIPEQFAPLRPQFIEKTDFCAALYSLSNVYTLGSLVPKNCVSKLGVHPISSLQTLIYNMCAKT